MYTGILSGVEFLMNKFMNNDYHVEYILDRQVMKNTSKIKGSDAKSCRSVANLLKSGE